MRFDHWEVRCARDRGKEFFVLALSNIAEGKIPLWTRIFLREDDLRDGLKRAELTGTCIEELIQQARQRSLGVNKAICAPRSGRPS